LKAVLRLTGGLHKGRKIKSPTGTDTRPTTEGNRETLFNLLENALQHSSLRVLDLFAGSGALTCEALSRGAETAVLIDSSRTAQKIISENIRSLDPQFPCRILSESRLERWPDELMALGEAYLPFDTIFCDPPYGKGLAERCLKFLLPHRGLFAPNALFCVEISKRDLFSVPPELEVLKDKARGESRLLVLRFVASS
jgi:16S rRNA (guanine966-N2)-methyltransferase